MSKITVLFKEDHDLVESFSAVTGVPFVPRLAPFAGFLKNFKELEKLFHQDVELLKKYGPILVAKNSVIDAGSNDCYEMRQTFDHDVVVKLISAKKVRTAVFPVRSGMFYRPSDADDGGLIPVKPTFVSGLLFEYAEYCRHLSVFEGKLALAEHIIARAEAGKNEHPILSLKKIFHKDIIPYRKDEKITELIGRLEGLGFGSTSRIYIGKD